MIQEDQVDGEIIYLSDVRAEVIEILKTISVLAKSVMHTK